MTPYRVHRALAAVLAAGLTAAGTPRFDSAGTLTIHSDKPYLYEFRDGQLILCDSVHSDGRHSITIQTLGCYVLLSSPL